MRNVLVDERDNLYVIDFSETRPRNVVSDFARLEPALKFEMMRLDNDEDLFVEVAQAAETLTNFVTQLRSGQFHPPDEGIRPPREK